MKKRVFYLPSIVRIKNLCFRVLNKKFTPKWLVIITDTKMLQVVLLKNREFRKKHVLLIKRFFFIGFWRDAGVLFKEIRKIKRIIKT